LKSITSSIPPALAAVDAYPHLRQQVASSLEAQTHRIAERTAHFIPRTAVIKVLDERLAVSSGGIVTLEGPPGSGTTALLCYLAATRPYPIWLPEDDAGGGLEALCAQLLALHGLPAPLVPPAAGRDATTLERLLAEAAARRPTDDPLIVLIDRPPDRRDAPLPPPFPATIPPGVVVVLACSPQTGTTGLLATRVALPIRSARTTRRLTQAAMRLGRSAEAAEEIAAAAGGSFLYVRIAIGLLESGLLLAGELPAGLEALHEAWWGQLDAAGRRLAAVLAAAVEPVDPILLAAAAGIKLLEVRRCLLRWRALIEIDERARLYHASTRDFIAVRAGDELAGAHAAYVALARARAGNQFESLNPISEGYLVRQLARHAALSERATRTDVIPLLASRAWMLARERHSGDLQAAAHDAAWALRAITQDGPPLRLARTAALAATLTLLARSLPPDALAETFLETLARGGARDETLRRARAMLDQLPDDRDKALVLRRLGEACYSQSMRAPAMRMLSEALDLEAPGLPRIWRDEREETLVAFARAAVAIDATDTALGITARIGHAERRGLIETEVVRWLLARGQRTRAEEVAYAIGHQPMHEWAMAEVAVGHVRAGDAARAEVVLSTLKTETALAWALAELASDAAHRGDSHAIDRVDALANQRLRDRALALVAQALAAGQQPDLALATARMAGDREVRARSLIDLSLQRLPNSAAALTYAAEDVAVLAGDERASLVAALAAAWAAAGQAEAGLRMAATLPEGEERDRAQSRVAVALARNGAVPAARQVSLAIADDDERDWALDEIARVVADQGDWDAAFALAAQITDAQQRVRTEVDLVIAWARAGYPAEAHDRAAQIALATERLRAQAAIAEPLIAQGRKTIALATLTQLHEPNARSRYQAALAAALAAHGELTAAHGVARAVPRPFDRARALIAIARASARADAAQSQLALGEALRVAAALGRKETYACLAGASETLAALGGAELLLAATSALDEVDSWWNY
jgi:hypothetical protein